MLVCHWFEEFKNYQWNVALSLKTLLYWWERLPTKTENSGFSDTVKNRNGSIPVLLDSQFTLN